MRAFLLLLAVVLVCVGVGIGAESAAGPTTYGPPGARFEAAFPGRPQMTTTRSSTPGVVRAWTYTGTGTDAQLVVDALLLRPPSAGSSFAILVAVRASRTPDIPRRDTEAPRPTNVGGLPATLVVGCLARPPASHDRCAGSLSVSPAPAGAHRVQWTVEASGPSVALVEELLSSFSPLTTS